MKRLKDKTAIVCGCAGGIGGATVKRLAAEGAAVVIADLNADFAEALAAEVVKDGGTAMACDVDISQEESIRRFYRVVLDRFGSFTILHNNAADTSPALMGRDLSVAYMDADVWDRAFAVNARGTMLMIKHALPTLVKAGGGSIINTSSGAALLGDVFFPAYAASKTAVNTLTKYVAAQFGKDGVRCNVVSPGLIITAGAQHVASKFDTYKRHTLLPELGAPEDIAAMVALLASDDGKFVTGQIIAVDGGITSHFPQFADVLPQFKQQESEQGHTIGQD
jgi:NAD(P)-dependent dehydrogenase (short-subunit alcohol dehydrogenase family)